MNPPPARSPEQRKQDTLRRLEQDVDLWVATAGGAPYLVPLSFLWDGAILLIATADASPTGRNLRANGRVRLGLGLTRDVVIIDGTATATEVSDAVGDAFAAKTGFDPRNLTGYRFFAIQPERIQAWREENELAGREIMRAGAWL
jgi:nitroimidazol reductase NimA-like FMN-containing flavoprotein (pyridoxamine 5'-phosphate oxidase superfamily)